MELGAWEREDEIYEGRGRRELWQSSSARFIEELSEIKEMSLWIEWRIEATGGHVKFVESCDRFFDRTGQNHINFSAFLMGLWEKLEIRKNW